MLTLSILDLSVFFTHTYSSFFPLDLTIVFALKVILSIPMLLSYILTGHWHFGTIGCKLFFAVENVNKLLSVMVNVPPNSFNSNGELHDLGLG